MTKMGDDEPTPLSESTTINQNNNDSDNKTKSVSMEVDESGAVSPHEDNDNPDGKRSKTPVRTDGSGSSPKTPSTKAASSDCFKTPQPSTPTTANSTKKRKRLTPDQRLSLEKERSEKKLKMEEEKQKKEQEKIEKAKQREAERVKKEEEKKRLEEEKRREKEKKDEEKKRQEEEKKREKEKKDEEKKRQEEEKKREREKKEEERKRLEEEKKQERLKKDEEKRLKLEEKEKELKKIEEKKAKQAQLFTNFFQKATPPKAKVITNVICVSDGTVNITTAASIMGGEKVAIESSPTSNEATKEIRNAFNPLPFQIKTDMAVAPMRRREKLTEEEVSALDSLFSASENTSEKCSGESNFLVALKKGNGRRDEKTVVTYYKGTDSDVQILNDNVDKPKRVDGYIKWRIKLLQFHDNRRPAYWGTWKRKGKKIAARKPFAQEEDLDYEFDSDDEWEDEPEDAEEIGDSDKEDNEEQEDADEDDEEGWMVPHGYLSDTEREGNGGDMESMKNKEKEFYKSLKERRLIGLPFIETNKLSSYSLRICPVFKSTDPVKPSRKRKPAKKKVDQPEDDTATSTEHEKLRRSVRPKKVPDTNNPYAKPPSGFLAMELSSDDEDMDWDEVACSSSSSESDDDEDEMFEDDDADKDPTCDSDLDNLFVPIREPKPPQT